MRMGPVAMIETDRYSATVTVETIFKSRDPYILLLRVGQAWRSTTALGLF